MKPKIGRTVYCIYYGNYAEAILVKKVGWLGKESFIIEDFSDYENFDSFEWFFKDYGITWFISLSKAKKAIFEQNPDIDKKSYYIEKVYDDYYEVKEKDDGRN